MKPVFHVKISFAPISDLWGENNTLSFDSTGATLHIDSSANSSADSSTQRANSLKTIQQCARTLAGLKLPEIELTGSWSLEEQWHFWQGSYSPLAVTKISFSELSSGDQQKFDSRVKVFSWVKQIINQTPEELSPINLAQQTADFITQLAPENVNYKMIVGEELNAKGYVGLYGVGRGSTRPAALLELDFIPDGTQDLTPAVALVGKGITFDSGGYSLKQSQGMVSMKSDMGGAATVAGSLALAITNGLNKRVRLLLCCAENLVSGHAYKLSDILHYRNDVSVEVVNTDAEGRLVLADGLIDASNSKAPVIIDAATLTGAAVVAVGDSYNAIFSMDDELASQFKSIAYSEFDPAWQLPLTKEHQTKCPSSFADTANSRPMPGGGAGGASNAAGFLSRFVNSETCQWLHIDLAACYKSTPDKLWSVGATGNGVRSIAAYLNQL